MVVIIVFIMCHTFMRFNTHISFTADATDATHPLVWPLSSIGS